MTVSPTATDGTVMHACPDCGRTSRSARSSADARCSASPSRTTAANATSLSTFLSAAGIPALWFRALAVECHSKYTTGSDHAF